MGLNYSSFLKKKSSLHLFGLFVRSSPAEVLLDTFSLLMHFADELSYKILDYGLWFRQETKGESQKCGHSWWKEILVCFMWPEIFKLLCPLYPQQDKTQHHHQHEGNLKSAWASSLNPPSDGASEIKRSPFRLKQTLSSFESSWNQWRPDPKPWNYEFRAGRHWIYRLLKETKPYKLGHIDLLHHGSAHELHQH